MRHANNCAFSDGRVPVKSVFDVRRTDVLATGNDDILLAVDDVDIAHRIPHGEVARVEITIANTARGFFRLFPVTGEHHVAARADFANAHAVLRHRVASIVEQL